MTHNSFTIIAHRGASGTEPENTFRAFRRAAAAGCLWIECDVRITKDGVPVILHDATVNRTTDGRGRVSRMTNKELRMLNTHTREGVPTLKETLQFAKKNRIQLILEIKDPRALEQTIRLVRAYSHTPLQFIISSISSSVVRRAKKLLPALATALIIGRPNIDWVRAAQHARADMVHVYAPRVTSKKVFTAHAVGLRVWAWTANTKKEALRLKKIGLDGIFTDDPHRLISLT